MTRSRRPSEAPPTLPGFEHMSRYWDVRASTWVARVAPGEFYVSKNDEMITTILGSCVAACIRDPERGIGGMNHFLLPNEVRTGALVSQATSYGSFAMENLINALMRNGARRDHLEVKVFGGGRMIAGMSDVGANNAEFVLNYLEMEGIPVLTQDLGGDNARALQYYPLSGRARVKKLNSMQAKSVAVEEKKLSSTVNAEPVGGSIDLF